jgi:hypothetical protein
MHLYHGYEQKLGQALDDFLSATPGCAAAKLAAGNEGRVVGLLAHFCFATFCMLLSLLLFE